MYNEWTLISQTLQKCVKKKKTDQKCEFDEKKHFLWDSRPYLGFDYFKNFFFFHFTIYFIPTNDVYLR